MIHIQMSRVLVSIRLNAFNFVQSRLIYFVCILPTVSLQMCYQTGQWLYYITLTEFHFHNSRLVTYHSLKMTQNGTGGSDNMILYSAVVAKGAPESSDTRE